MDFAATGFVDSAALGMLLQLREHAGNRAEAVRLINVRGDVREVLAAAGFEELFRIG